MKKIIFISFALVLSFIGVAQEKINEGVLTFKQSMSSDNEQINAQLQMMGETTATTYFKGDKSRNESSTPMTGDMVIIMDGSKKQMLMLMDMGMGKKYTLQSTDPKEEDLKNVTVEKGTETKTVLGYKCQKYTVKMKQNGQDAEMVLYTTDKISAISQNTTAMGDKVEGFPLYFEMKMNQMGAVINVISEVTSIEEKAVSDEKFSLTPPEGYVKM